MYGQQNVKKKKKLMVVLQEYIIIKKFIYYFLFIYLSGDCGSAVVKVLCYKSEGRWFDPSWCQWNFSLT